MRAGVVGHDGDAGSLQHKSCRSQMSWSRYRDVLLITVKVAIRRRCRRSSRAPAASMPVFSRNVLPRDRRSLRRAIEGNAWPRVPIAATPSSRIAQNFRNMMDMIDEQSPAVIEALLDFAEDMQEPDSPARKDRYVVRAALIQYVEHALQSRAREHRLFGCSTASPGSKTPRPASAAGSPPVVCASRRPAHTAPRRPQSQTPR